ncbi:NaeI family type II restriction endonuclease [Streptomyces sp. NPDC002619]|uniref:NaeI family type II restriction endonuclease n=1 Tax=Streptomyces sp. NPDC002619 TaxID=3364655 RepID=UPI0036BDE9E3
MAGIGGGQGRPRRPLQGMSPQEDQVATLLRVQADQAQLTLRDIAERLTPEMLGGRPVPGVATISKRFAGEGLDVNAVFVEAVLRLCAPEPAVADALCEQATVLLTQASEARRRQRAGRDQRFRDASSSEVVLLRRQVAEQQEALRVEQQSRQQAEATTFMLLALLAHPPAPAAQLQTPAEPTSGQGDSVDLGRRMATLEAQVAQLHENPMRYTPSATDSRAAAVVLPAREHTDHDRPTPTAVSAASINDDVQLHSAYRELLAHDPDGSRVARAIRTAFDDVLDGPRTGRYRLAELQKPEKTYLGLLVERTLVNALGLRREEDGDQADLLLAGDIGIALRFSLSFGGWTFSQEHVDRLVLLLHADDETNRWNLGIVRLREEILAQGGNRDFKRRLAAHHRREIVWLHHDASLPANALADLSPAQLQTILKGSSRMRVNQLLRAAQGLVISRNNLETVAMRDADRRMREARDQLAADGIIVLAGSVPDHRNIARRLQLPVPGRHEYVTAQLAPVDPKEADLLGRTTVDADGETWALALPDDTVRPLPPALRRGPTAAPSPSTGPAPAT